MSEANILDAVRSSSAETREQLLLELLAERVRAGGRWPIPIADRSNEIVAFLFPRPGASTKSPPKLSSEREAELDARMGQLDDSRDLRDYISGLSKSGGSSCSTSRFASN